MCHFNKVEILKSSVEFCENIHRWNYRRRKKCRYWRPVNKKPQSKNLDWDTSEGTRCRFYKMAIVMRQDSSSCK
jgi:hypothetical protein